MAPGFLIWFFHVSVFLTQTQQYTLLYYDNMEDIQATGWMQENSYFVFKNTNNNYFCQGGGFYITGQTSYPSSGGISRNFDISGYTDIVVAVDIGEVSLVSPKEASLYYTCDPVYAGPMKGAIYLTQTSNYICDRNFSVVDYSTVTCSNAKTLNLDFSIWTGTSAKAHLDEVRIYYGNTYAASTAPTYDIVNGVYIYDDMQDFRNTGWVVACQSCTQEIGQGIMCGSDGAYCVKLSGNGAYVSRYNIDTTSNNFVAVQYVFGATFDVSSSAFAQVQYTCGDAQTFQPIATHFGSTSAATQYTVILPCTDSNTAIRLYSYVTTNVAANFDEICVVTWNEGENKWSSTHCPNSVAFVEYSSNSIYWYENFDNFNQWTANVPDVLTTGIWLQTAADISGKPMNGQFVRMSGNDVSLVSRALNGYAIDSADIQINIQTECGRSSGDQLFVEIFCDLATNNQQWQTLETFVGDFEAQNYIITSNPCKFKGINQMRFRSVANQNNYVYIDNIYYCYNGQCGGDAMTDANAAIIFYDSNPSVIPPTTWIYTTDTYFRRRFNNLNSCDDLWIQFDITKPDFTVSDSITVEYRYDASATESYCSGSTAWTPLITYTNSDFIDQKIFPLSCPVFYGSLSVRFSMSGNSGVFSTLNINNFYICNSRAACPAPYPTRSPTKNPSVNPSIPPTTSPSNNPSTSPSNNPSNNPSAMPSKAPSPKQTFDGSVLGKDGLIEKEGINCFSGYKDLAKDDEYYNKLCEACPDGTAGTYGKCNECGLFQVPNDARDSCEYYQPWWLWLAETLLGVGVIGIVVWCCRKGKKKANTKRNKNRAQQPPQYSMDMEMEMANTQGNTGDYVR